MKKTILLFLADCLICLLGFFLGYLITNKQEKKEEPITIEVPTNTDMQSPLDTALVDAVTHEPGITYIQVVEFEKAAAQREQTNVYIENLIAEKEAAAARYYAEQTSVSASTYEDTSVDTGEDYSGNYFENAGVLYDSGYKWTWYSENVLPGGGLDIPGRHVDESGYVCDEEGNICIASSDLPAGTVIETPLGKNGKVYDSGCASGTVDVYTSW